MYSKTAPLCTAACLKGSWQHQTSALPWLVFQYKVTQGLNPGIPQDSHWPPQEFQPAPLLAKIALITSPASSWALGSKGSCSQHLPSSSPTTPWCCSLQCTQHRQQHFCQRLDKGSLWFIKKLFCPAILRFCPIFLSFLLGSRFAAGLELCGYLII